MHRLRFLRAHAEPCQLAPSTRQHRRVHARLLRLDGTQACRCRLHHLVPHLHPRALRAQPGTLLAVANLWPHHQLADRLRMASLRWAPYHQRLLIGWMWNELVDSNQLGNLPGTGIFLLSRLPLPCPILLKTPPGLCPARG